MKPEVQSVFYHCQGMANYVLWVSSSELNGKASHKMLRSSSSEKNIVLVTASCSVKPVLLFLLSSMQIRVTSLDLCYLGNFCVYNFISALLFLCLVCCNTFFGHMYATWLLLKVILGGS